MSHRDSLIKKNRKLSKPMDLMNVGFVGNIGTAGGNPAVGGGFWKELGRQELGDTANTITVSGLTTHKYYQVLYYALSSGSIKSNLRMNNISTGQIYSQRTSLGGATDVPAVSQNQVLLNADGAAHQFGRAFVSNISGEEKLVISHGVHQDSAGAGTPCSRMEGVGKMVPSPLSTNITQFNLVNTDSGLFDTGSQMVVLGWEDTVTHALTDNFWKYGNRVEVGTATDQIDIGSFGSHEWLLVRFSYIATGGSVNLGLYFNNNATSGENASNRSINGGADSTQSSANKIFISGGAGINMFGTMIIRNQSDKNKLCIYHDVTNDIVGAGNDTGRTEGAVKWANTSSQITTINCANSGGGSYDVGSFIEVWYAD